MRVKMARTQRFSHRGGQTLPYRVQCRRRLITYFGLVDSIMNFTLLLIAVTVVVSWNAFKNRKLADRCVLWPPAISRFKQYDRLLTHGFIHGDLAHLIFNMLTLFFFGQSVEQVMQRITGSAFTFLFFYLTAIVVAILPSYIKESKNPEYLSLGSSGAISAVLFAFILLQPWALIIVFFLPIPSIVYAALYIGYSVWMQRQGESHINHSAHLSGAAFGLLFMLCMEPRLASIFLYQLARPHFSF